MKMQLFPQLEQRCCRKKRSQSWGFFCYFFFRSNSEGDVCLVLMCHNLISLQDLVNNYLLTFNFVQKKTWKSHLSKNSQWAKYLNMVSPSDARTGKLTFLPKRFFWLSNSSNTSCVFEEKNGCSGITLPWRSWLSFCIPLCYGFNPK